MKFILSIFFFLAVSGSAQKIDSKEIYTKVLLAFYQNKPASIVVSSTPSNNGILSTDFISLIDTMDGKKQMQYYEINESWLKFFKKVNLTKKPFISAPISTNKQAEFHVNLVSQDSLNKVGVWNFSKTFKVRDGIQLSGILHTRNKAVVDLTLSCGMSCGEGRLFFLEKHRGTWKVIWSLATWIT